MRKTTKKYIAAFVALSIFLAGCAGSGQTAQTVEYSAETTEASVETSGKKVLRFGRKCRRRTKV